MGSHLIVLLTLVANVLLHRASATNQSYSNYVNLFIGTQGPVVNQSYDGGNVFPGPALPFGVVKVGIDTTEFNISANANAGYTPDGNVTAITLLHESGTGGAPKYGLIPQMPLTTLDGINVLDNITYMQPRVEEDVASVGYYKSVLQNGVKIELGASMHAGLMQYTFPGGNSSYILVDLSHYLPTQGESSGEQLYSNSHLDLSDDGSQYSGYGIYRGGWNQGPDYTVYFCASFDTTPSSSQLFYGPYTDPYWPNSTGVTPTFSTARSMTAGTPGYQFADRLGALFEFPANATVVRSKVGISWISVDAACQFTDEIEGYDLNSTIAAAVDKWDSSVLSLIKVVDTSNSSLVEMLYSALYRSHLLPSNRTGENPNFQTSEPTYDDFYTIWDTFRCLNPMYLLMEPEIEEGIVRSLIDVWRYERFMPDGRSGFSNGRTQGGSNADNVLADAYVKGLRGGINWTDGYLAMKTDAEVVPYNTFDPEDLTQSTKEGRGALPDWLQYGYVTPNFGRCISKTIEFSLNDFSLYQVAQGEMPSDAATYLNRSAGWQRIWSHNITSLNFTGFLVPLWPNNTIMSGYDPLDCGECEWSSIAYEALPWEYSWTVPFDMETLISFMGGASTTEARLDTMFVPGLQSTGVGEGNGAGTTIFNPGNEPSFATPFLYHYLAGGRQFKSVLRSRQTVDTYYGPTPDGLPGNSDAGAIDSWLLWNLIGLYPVVTQPIYLILSPWFADFDLSTGYGRYVHITAQGLDHDAGSYYVQSLTVDGQPWSRNWITHDELTNASAINFVLGTNQTSWDADGELPPSPGHHVL